MTDTKALRKDDGDLAESYGRNDIPDLYQQGHSLNQIVEMTEVNYSAVRRDLIAAGVRILSRKEAVARFPGGWNRQRVGEKRPPTTPETRQNMSQSAIARCQRNGIRGYSIDKDGYHTITTGENRDRPLHVVIMEQRLGRRLLSDENVHHIDHDPSNNNENNLALVTKSGHHRLHHFEDKLAGKERPKNKITGRFESRTVNT